MSAADEYKKMLGQELEKLFGGDFKFYKTNLELKRKRKNGFDVIVLSGSNKFSPYINVAFYFGRNFDAAKKVETLLGSFPMPYQIQQYSLNVRAMKGLEYYGEGSWEANIEIPPNDMAITLKNAIESVAFPFFDRFTNLESAQQALATDDSWCCSPKGSFYHMLLMIDASLNDLQHFKNWSACLDDFYLKQANEDLQKLEKLR